MHASFGLNARRFNIFQTDHKIIISVCPEITLCMRLTNGQWRYITMSSLISWAQTQNYLCMCLSQCICIMAYITGKLQWLAAECKVFSQTPGTPSLCSICVTGRYGV